MNETPLEKNELQLTEKYRVGFDKMNIILSKRYQKREGKGRNAPFINEYAYDKTSASYYGNLKSFANRLVEKEFMEELSETDMSNINNLIEVIDKVTEKMDEFKEEIFNHINEHITIDLGETKRQSKKIVKGMEISED